MKNVIHHFIKTMTTTTVSAASKTLTIDQSSFRNLLQQVVKECSPEDNPYGFRSDTSIVLQQVTEDFLIEMFKKGKLNSCKWDRDIVLPRDLIIGLMDMNFDYITLSQREKPKSLMTLFNKIKK